MSTVGIIGTGHIGSAIARALVRAGISVVLTNRRGPSSLSSLVQELGPLARADNAAGAAAADIVVLAVNWSKIPSAIAEIADWGGRILIDANNPIEAPAFQPFELGGRTSSEVVASLVPGARVVKAFNHLPPRLLSDDPAVAGGQRVLFLAGDDRGAAAAVGQLARRLGFHPVDLGSLREGGRLTQFPGGPLTSLNLVRLG